MEVIIVGFDSSQLLKAILNSVDAAILMVDSNLKVVMCNRKFEEFFGVTPSLILNQDKREAITRDIKWRVKDPEEFQDKLFWLYENPEIISNDEVEVELPRRRILHRFSGPVFDEEKNLLGRVELYYDITSAKDLQKEIEFKNDQLFLLNAAATAISQSLEINKLLNYFLRRVIQATNCHSGIIYVKNDSSLKLAKVEGEIKAIAKIPRFLAEEDWDTISWGPIGGDKKTKFLENIPGNNFFICFPAYSNQRQINGLCILIWDRLPEQWLNRALFNNVGIYLGIGIRNAYNHQEAQRLAILQERDRIAMEMHDGLAQTLSYLGLGIDTIYERILNNRIDEDSINLLEQLRDVIDRSYGDVREAIIGLRIDISENIGFFTALENYIREFEKLTKIKVKLKVSGEKFDPTFENQLHVIRIIQEALTNVRRHSKATEVHINFSFSPKFISVEIEDDGLGFEKKLNENTLSSLHQGIRIMKKRAAILEGILDIETSRGKGTKVLLYIPIKKEAAK